MTYSSVEEHPTYQAWTAEHERLRQIEADALARMRAAGDANRTAESQWQEKRGEARAAGKPDPPYPQLQETNLLHREYVDAAYVARQHAGTRVRVLADIADDLIPVLRDQFDAIVVAGEEPLRELQGLHQQAYAIVGLVRQLLAAQENRDPNVRIVNGPSTKMPKVTFDEYLGAINGLNPFAALDGKRVAQAETLPRPEVVPKGRVIDLNPRSTEETDFNDDGPLQAYRPGRFR